MMLPVVLLAASWACQLQYRLPPATDWRRAPIERAVTAWTSLLRMRVCETTFANQSRTIDISFVAAHHPEDPIALVPGLIPAHTFRPGTAPEPLAGDVHLLDSEPWTEERLYLVTLHEIGHALGLPESDDPSTIMYPYESQRTATSITDADKRALSKLYKLRKSPVCRATNK